MIKTRQIYFRCQYQIGGNTESEVVVDTEYISARMMTLALVKLAVKVKNNINYKTGGKVAMMVLYIINDLIKNVHMDQQGTGGSKSYYLDRKSKYKDKRTERVDVEFYGIGGRDKEEDEKFTRFVGYWKKLILKR